MELFKDESDLLTVLHSHWVDLLSRRIYGEPHYPLGEERTREVYTALVEEFPTLRAVLERYQEFPAVAHLVNEERVLLARAAGHLGHASIATLAWRGTRPARHDSSAARGLSRALARSSALRDQSHDELLEPDHRRKP